MAIDWGRMARGVATGYLSAKIANTEANDKLNADIHKAAGINFHTNTYPEWQKKERVREREFKQISNFFESDDIANYWGDQGAITGDGKSLDTILATIKARKMDPNDFAKDFKWEGSTYEERKAERFTDIQDAGRIATSLSTGSSKIGPKTAESQLEGTVTDKITPPAIDTGIEPVGGILPGGEKEPSIAQVTRSDITKKPRLSDIYGAAVSERGVESKYDAISKAVNQLGGYGESVTLADGSIEFRIADEMITTSNAHIALADHFSTIRKDIDQLKAADLALQELNSQTITPFNLLATDLNTEYTEGNTGTSGTLALGGETVDVTTLMKHKRYNNQSIKQFIEGIYNNRLLDDGQGNVNISVFTKFIENIPNNFVVNKGTENEERYKDVLANAHAMGSFFKI